MDFQCADCGCLCGLGQIRRTWWKNPRVHIGKRYERVIGAKNWRQALPARLGHWGNRYGWCRGGRRRAFAECGRAQRTLRLPQPSPLWHCLGCYGRSRVLLARRIAIWSGQKAIQQASGANPTVPEKAGRYANRNFSGSAICLPIGSNDGRRHGQPRAH